MSTIHQGTVALVGNGDKVAVLHSHSYRGCKLLEDRRAAAPKTVVAERQLIYCRLDSGQQTWHT